MHKPDEADKATIECQDLREFHSGLHFKNLAS